MSHHANAHSHLNMTNGTLVKHMSKDQLEAISRKRFKEIEKKKKELRRNDDKLLDLNDKVSKISVELKDLRAHEKDSRVSASRILAHTKALDLDLSKRPADREQDIRTYSKMDKDIWRYDQVRNWFNTYATEQEEYRFVPSQTGYTLSADG